MLFTLHSCLIKAVVGEALYVTFLLNRNSNWQCFVHYIPASVTFIPWDLGWLGYRKHKLIPNGKYFIHHRTYSADVCTLMGRALPYDRAWFASLRQIAVSPRKMGCTYYKVRHIVQSSTEVIASLIPAHKSLKNIISNIYIV